MTRNPEKKKLSWICKSSEIRNLISSLACFFFKSNTAILETLTLYDTTSLHNCTRACLLFFSFFSILNLIQWRNHFSLMHNIALHVHTFVCILVSKNDLGWKKKCFWGKNQAFFTESLNCLKLLVNFVKKRVFSKKVFFRKRIFFKKVFFRQKNFKFTSGKAYFLH